MCAHLPFGVVTKFIDHLKQSFLESSRLCVFGATTEHYAPGTHKVFDI